jgi:hypothetical protein
MLYEVTFGNGKFLASCVEGPDPFKTLRFYTSNNGFNWVAGSFSSLHYSAVQYGHRFLTFANGMFYEFVGELGMVSTPDGNTVTVASAPSDGLDPSSMVYANPSYVLLGLNGEVWTSTAGTNWTQSYGGIRSTINQIIRGADTYLAVGIGPMYSTADGSVLHQGGPVLASNDGVHFGPVANSPSLAYGDIAFDGSNYVTASEAGAIYTSNDGLSWVQRTSNTPNDLRGLCRGSTRWVAVGRVGTLISSPNTLAWTLRFSGTGNNLNGAAYGNGVYVAVGDGGTIISSPDTVTWEAQYSGSTSTLLRVRFLNGQFFAVGANGTILTSADGATWQSLTSITPRTLNDIDFGNGRYVACGFDPLILNLPEPMWPGNAYAASFNVLLQSTNGVNWEDISTKIPASVGLNSIKFLNGSFWVCGENGGILQTDSLDGIPRLEGTLLDGNAGFQLRLTLNVPQSWRIQASTSLVAPSWQDLVTITNPTPPFIWNDTNAASHPIRFYRVASP